MKLQTKDYCNKRLKSTSLLRLPIVNDIIFIKVIKRSLILLSRQDSISNFKNKIDYTKLIYPYCLQHYVTLCLK